ncbi:MAG: NAD-glutamate dehydrogenase [Acidobacteriota bacterium]
MDVTTIEERKDALVERLAEEASARVPPPLAEASRQFVQNYFALVSPDDILYTAQETLLGQALSLWQFGNQRSPGTAKVRIFNPSMTKDGWTLDHTVVEIVNDDMPFLVDSIAAEINRGERNIHLLIHPIVGVHRDSSGRRIDTAPGSEESSDAFLVTESYMHIEIDQETEPQELVALTERLQIVLGDVRASVTDWHGMRRKLNDDIEEIESSKLPLASEEIEEGLSFLRWLVDDHFLFLGYRRYVLGTEDGHDVLRIVPDSGLGILRHVRKESSERSRTPFSQDFGAYARKKELLIIAKANNSSTVHRDAHMDRISVKLYDENGVVYGEDRFLGLFTSAAYGRSVREIPLLRRKTRQTIERAGFAPASHDGKALLQILETLPRDELFQIPDEDLFEMAMGILQLQERHRIALFVRKDVFERFVSAMVYVPRDRYTTELREKLKKILEEAFNGKVTALYTQVSDSPLARGHFIIKTTPGEVPEYDTRRLEAYIAEAARTWNDHLREESIRHLGEEAGLDIQKRFKDSFPVAYREVFSAGEALGDILRIEKVIETGGLSVDLYRRSGEHGEKVHCKIIHAGTPLALSDIIPLLENMGLLVELSVPFDIRTTGSAEPIRIRDFSLVGSSLLAIDLDAAEQRFQEAFSRVWHGQLESDGFNRLVLGAGLYWQETVVLRAYCKYLRQTGITFSEAYMQQTLAGNPGIAALLVRLFTTVFDPALTEPERAGAPAIRKEIDELLEDVSNPDEDRILRRFLNLIDSTLRTNYFQRTDSGERKTYLSFKFDSRALEGLPLPRPMFEIWVYSPRVEGVHLRGGKVARGGIRWSDRREDFRIEVLGLMKAQTVKNTVIIPVGSKGGFVVKHPPAGGSRDEILKEGIACYQTFLRGLLDLTDNLSGDAVVPPPDVVRRDPDDTYLVVAADKGTASFSDIANAVSAEYGFWLGDAFASGGSAGYDHKKMGITARGAWEAVQRHFRELGTDIQTEDFTVVGVGDMSGDVFGNGMLLSRHIKLLGAFNHLHIFVDPDPDPEASFVERERLFDLPRSSWIDYDPAVLSAGGAVFDRRAKHLEVSERVRALFDLSQSTVTPNELIRAILKAQVDLLWLGGIGTYVKSSEETQADAQDRANDTLRVNADELRVSVVGEGANLGVTQKGRVEFALLHGAIGGKINTDAIDNSAGVDTSDHEVNIKILLDALVSRGELSPERRLTLLAEMTDEVAHLVLRDNYVQTLAISIAAAQGNALLDQQQRLMRTLERAGKLDRALEFLPDDETLAERQSEHLGLTRPEIAVLLAYSKIAVYQELLQSDLPDDPELVEDLLLYFPVPLRDSYRAGIERHRLRREIIANFITNTMVNRVGPAFVSRLEEETSKPASDVARAYTIMRESFAMRETWAAIESLDGVLPAELQYELFIEAGHLIERTTLWLLRTAYEKLDIKDYIGELRPRIEAVEKNLDRILPAPALIVVQQAQQENIERGMPPALARRMATLDILASACDLVEISRSSKENVEDVACVYFELGSRFDLDTLRAAAENIAAESPWQKAAISVVVDDLFAYQSTLASRVLRDSDHKASADAVARWLTARPNIVARLDQLLADIHGAAGIELPMLSVFTRQVRYLVES